MISFDEAVRRVTELARPLGSERVPIGEAAGRVLASPVVAKVDSPPCDVSAMDGYAVREVDLPGVLRIIGESFAGSGFGGALDNGACVRIFTGAPVPEGADRVVIQEVVEREDDRATLPDISDGTPNIRRRGMDFSAGEEVLRTGELLNPRALVAAAGADVAAVDVWRRPKIVVLSTGDELVPPGEARSRPGTIPDSVSWGVAALAREWGGDPLATQRLGDDLRLLQRAAGDALERADLVIVTGGASVGEKDFAKSMFEPHGLELVFSKVAMKPGKPVWLGRARGCLILGLPGNPTSAMATARLLLAPLVAGLCGRAGALDWKVMRLGALLPACGERETFVRARLTPVGAVPVGNQDSSAQRALTQADLLLRTYPNDPPRETGDMVQALAF